MFHTKVMVRIIFMALKKIEGQPLPAPKNHSLYIFNFIITYRHITITKHMHKQVQRPQKMVSLETLKEKQVGEVGTKENVLAATDSAPLPTAGPVTNTRRGRGCLV